ncbi:MAG: helicase-related protein [Candidatus Hydrothermarchaeales archaeon]
MYISHPLIKKDTIESRLYQETIVGEAINKNTLVVMPTALGKTVIAVLLSAHFLEKYPQKKILILAPTRPLAAQHAARFKEFLNIDESRISIFTGTTPPQKRRDKWTESRVICATPHVIHNDFISRSYSPEDLSLVVFDEAHRAVGGYPYPFIASQLECRILALTASPGGDEQSIRTVCKNLKIKNVEIRDESDPDVAPYVKGLDIEWKKVKMPEPYLVIRNLLLGLLKKRLKVLKGQRLLKSASINVTKKELLSIQSTLQERFSLEHDKSLFPALSAVSACLTITHAIELLETQGLGPFSSYLKRTVTKAASASSSKAVRALVREHDFKRALAIAERVSEKTEDPKIEALKDIIRAIKKDTKVIIFAQYRDSVKEIVDAVNELEGATAVRFVGQATKVEDPGLSQKKQLKILEGFREGGYNILVATSVAEEGLDIPAVDLVIFHEPVPSEIRAIQRRGRTGRTSVGRVVVLMTERTRDEGFYWSSVAKERQMKRTLKRLRAAFEKPAEKKISDWS